MHPILLDFSLPIIGTVEFPSHLCFILLGFFIAIYYLQQSVATLGLPGAPSTAMVDLGLIALVLGIVGARAMSILTDGMLIDFVNLCTNPIAVVPHDAAHIICSSDVQCLDGTYTCDVATKRCIPDGDCWKAFKFWEGGLTFYGGFLLAGPGILYFLKRKNLPMPKIADLAAPAIMLGLFFGRIGCFLAGCCYGRESDTPLAVTFPHSLHPTHPTQLYEAFTVFLLFLALHYFFTRRKKNDGEVFAWMLILYGFFRSVIELFRADPRGSLGPLSTSQIISLPCIAFGCWILVRIRKKNRKNS